MRTVKPQPLRRSDVSWTRNDTLAYTASFAAAQELDCWLRELGFTHIATDDMPLGFYRFQYVRLSEAVIARNEETLDDWEETLRMEIFYIAPRILCSISVPSELEPPREIILLQPVQTAWGTERVWLRYGDRSYTSHRDLRPDYIALADMHDSNDVATRYTLAP